ncbi:peptide chain release factor 1 [bacterium]|nr:peptide chain release factor 1 [bacterium]
MNQELIDKQVIVANSRLADVEIKMSDPEVVTDRQAMTDLGREHRRLRTIIQAAEKVTELDEHLQQSRELLNEEDQEIRDLAQVEIDELTPQLERAHNDLQLALIPQATEDTRDAIIEIRAGTGGQEAAIFAGDLFKMYQRFAETKGWRLEELSSHPSEMGGFKEVVFAVRGDEAYGILKYEGGVHRVQRVPETESQGRIHTSAASVAVLPEAEEVDVEIDPNDLRIDVYRSSGPGGQSVNTTDSAVRITHVPTGLVVTCQDEKSQHKNKAKALRVLRARLYEQALEEERAKRSASRKSLVGSGDRSAKIRTYNFPQGRVTDHRINLTLYRLNEILNGSVDEVLEALQLAEAEERLKDIE